MRLSENMKYAISERLAGWRIQATGYAALSVMWTIVTPIMAERVQYQVAEGVTEHWLIAWTMGNWISIYAVMIVFIYGVIELMNRHIMSERSFEYDQKVDELVTRLVERAGLKYIPEVVYVPSKTLINAGASSSYLYGKKVILFGDVLKLSQDELEAVVAHEIAHLRMGDVPLSHALSSLVVALRTVNFLLFVVLVASVFVDDHDVLWFLGVTYIVTYFGSRLARAAQLKVSRICEYRADALAVHWTSDAHREHLVAALKKVKELSLVVALRKNELNEVDSGTHPTLRNRARALGIRWAQRMVASTS